MSSSPWERSEVGSVLPEVPGFRILAELGRGSTSRVYRACQVALDREVALKITTTSGDAGKRRALRLFQEARLAGALDHPGIVRGIDAGEGDGFSWFAMDLVDGESLQDILDREGRLPLAEVLSLAEGILEALDHAHRRGVVHRDVKPSNILIDLDGLPRLLDLGLARRSAEPGLTQDGAAVGTPQYMSPEQARRPDRVDGRSDLFSLGATLYRALCGVPPFDADTVGEVVARLLQQAPVRPSRAVAGIPQAVDLVLMRALEKRPERRYQTAEGMLSDVRALRVGRPVRRAPRLAFFPRTHRARLVWAGAVAMGLGFGLWTVTRSPEHREAGPEVSTHRDVEAEERAAWVKRLDALEADLTALGPYSRVREVTSLRDVPLDLEGHRGRILAAARLRYLEGVDRVLDDAKARAGRGEVSERSPKSEVVRLMGWPDPEDRETTEMVTHRVAAAEGELERIRSEASDVRAAAYVDAVDAFGKANEGRFLSSEDVERGIAAALESVGNRHELDAERGRRVDERLAFWRRDFAERPRRWWKSQTDAVRTHLASRQFDRAAQVLADAWARVALLVPDAKVEGEDLERRISAAVEEARNRAQELVRLVERGDLAPLPTGERERRRDGLRQGLLVFPEAVDAAALATDRAGLAGLLDAVEQALQLRNQVLGAADGLGKPPGTPFRPRLREGSLVSERILEGRDGSDLLARDELGYQRRYPVADLTAPTLLELAGMAEIPLAPGTGALLAHWDGDDDVALGLARALDPLLPARPFVLAMTERAGARRLEEYDTPAQREAYAQLLLARELASSHDDGKTLDALDGLMKSLKGDKAWRTGAFWRRHGSQVEALRKAIVRRASLTEAWSSFGTAAAVDGSSGRVRLRSDLGLDAKTLKAVVWPAHGLPATDGIRLVADPGDAARRPDLLTPLQLELPSLEGTSGELSLDVVFESGPTPPAHLRLSLHGVQCLWIFETLDDRPARRLPLHGLERDLYVRREVYVAGAWPGTWEAYQQHLSPQEPRWIPEAGRVQTVSLSWTRSGDVQIRGGNWTARVTAPRGALDDGGLKVSGYPTIRLANLRGDISVPEER